MPVNLGISPLTWSNDDLPVLGSETPLDVCLAEARKAGYTGVELGNKFPRNPTVLRHILDEHGLQLISGWFSGRLLERSVSQEIEAIDSHLNLLNTLGAKVLVYCEVTGSIHGAQSVPISRRPRLNEWAEFGAGITQVADYCRAKDVRIAYHHHMGTIVESESDIDSLMAHTGDSVGLLVDTGHLTYAGANPSAVQKRHAKRINHVHCKDVRSAVLHDARNRDLSFLDAVLNGVFTVPGDGDVDYQALFDGLKSSAYSGWLVVEAEQDPAVAQPLMYATMGEKYLNDTCRNAGIEVMT